MPDSKHLGSSALSHRNEGEPTHLLLVGSKPATLASDDGELVAVRVPNTLVKNWLMRNYSAVVDEAMAEVGRPGCHVEFVAEAADPSDIDQEPGPPGPQEIPNRRDDPELDPVTPLGGLIPRYTFDTFVVGPSNQFAEGGLPCCG